MLVPRYNSVRSLVLKAEKALNYGKINEALVLVYAFVEKIITEPLCTAQVFSSSELDRLCMSIGRHALNHPKLSRSKIPEGDSNENKKEVYIVSRLQSAGGHSQLITDFIQKQPGKDHLILLTGLGGPSDSKYFMSRFSSEINVELYVSPKVDFFGRLIWLQSELIKSNPERIHLFNSHQDSVAISAVVPELNFPISFYHHCDHHLALGIHLPHLRHIDLHPMGYHYCQKKLGIDNHYLPLTFQDLGVLTTEIIAGVGLTTATVARSSKVEIPYFISYVNLVAQIISATKGRHIHIGRLSLYARLKIRYQLYKLGISQERFVYIKWTSSVWKSMKDHEVDLYINSFPYASGLTIIEVMGAGIPVVMHKHIYSRTLSALEMAYEEAFCWTYPEELLSFLENTNKENLAKEKIIAREHYEKFHSPETLKSYLKNNLELSYAPPPMREYRYVYDEWAALIESQISIPKIIYRAAYRFWLKIRSKY